MPNFSDIIKQQRKSGKGAISSLATAVGQKSLEKIDPRNYLFNKSGVLTALFPKLKGYQAKATTGAKLQEAGSGSSAMVEPILVRLDSISGDASIAAKNFIMLPHLARDINVLRQNIIKLVKSEGIKPAQRADMFFLRSKEREDAYESQNTSSPIKMNQLESELGQPTWMDAVLGAAVLAGITTAFMQPEFRGKMLDILGESFKLVGFKLEYMFTGMLAVFGGIIAAKVAFRTAARLSTALIVRSTKSLAGLMGLVGVLTAITMAAKEGKDLYDGFFEDESKEIDKDLGLNEDGTPKSSKKQEEDNIVKKTLKTLDENTLTIVGTGAVVGVANSKIQPQLQNKINKASGGKTAYNSKAERFVKINPETGSQKFVKGKDLPLGKIMERFRTFAVKASSRGWMTRIIAKVSARLGISIALKVGTFLAGLAAAPFTMGLSLLLNIASGILLAYDIYLLYDMFFGSNSLEDELEKEDNQDNTKPTPAEEETKKNLESSNSPNPLGEPVKPGTGSPGTFGSLSYEEQEAFLDRQFKQEGNTPGKLAYDLKNPGAMLYSSWQKQFGAIPNSERGTVYSNGKKVPFAEFPTMIQGRMAQRYLWSTKYANKPLDTAVATWSGTKMGTTDHANYLSTVTGKNPTPSASSPLSAAVASYTAQNRVARTNSSTVVNMDNSKVTNQDPNSNNNKGEVAGAYDQLFAMLFMDHSSIPQ
jgi:hypothetical protein